MSQWRYRLGRHTGPWRDTRAEAIQDAAEAGYVRHDERYNVPMKDEMLVIEEGE